MDRKFRANMKQSVHFVLSPFYFLQLEYIFKPDVRACTTTHFGHFKEGLSFWQPHGCSQFIRNAFEAATKAELVGIVEKQLEMIKTRLASPEVESNVLADCVVRGCVAQLLLNPSR